MWRRVDSETALISDFFDFEATSSFETSKSLAELLADQRPTN